MFFTWPPDVEWTISQPTSGNALSSDVWNYYPNPRLSGQKGIDWVSRIQDSNWYRTACIGHHPKYILSISSSLVCMIWTFNPICDSLRTWVHLTNLAQRMFHPIKMSNDSDCIYSHSGRNRIGIYLYIWYLSNLPQTEPGERLPISSWQFFLSNCPHSRTITWEDKFRLRLHSIINHKTWL